jgi:L-alanine-DL-glutamate epimerase-like enolase superfamily enzyme
MKIEAIETWPMAVPLARPYTIAFQTTSAVDIMVVRLQSATGESGLGAATPEPAVTGEDFASCRAALVCEELSWLVGQDLSVLPRIGRELQSRLRATPAARAALDMALYDLWSKSLKRPLVELLGRAHDSLPTSITIGIKGVEETLAEAEEYIGRGFRVLKVKLGKSLEEDLARLQKLRESYSSDTITIRTDANQGYTLPELRHYLAAIVDLNIEFTEQPLPAARVDELAGLPQSDRERLVADESLLDEVDALRLVLEPTPCHIFNIKLMKCGGIRPALGIARIGEARGVDLMWGCMDESVIGISAALHAALACPATRYLDLDGSFDLARDPARGGFALSGGVMRTLDRPGLGVELAD